MSVRARRPGQPLAMLVLLVGAWTMGRAIAWEPPFGRTFGDTARPLLARPGADPALPHQAMAGHPRRPTPWFAAGKSSLLERATGRGKERGPPPPAYVLVPALIPASFPATLPRVGGPSVAAVIPPRDEPLRTLPARARPGRSRLPRWSGDGWLLLRPGSRAALATAPFGGRYGASQTGAVLRYRLGSGRRAPALYGRTSAALKSPWERELALGLAARPVPGVPVAAQAEVRLTRSAGRTSIGPAVMAVSQLDPIALPFGARADAYLAGGYVAGAADTAFVDGHLRLERDVARLGGASLRLGGGMWGGAQDGAAALDVGPAAVIAFELGEVRSNLELGYRLRVAGNAEPRSGPALTLSTGF